MELVKVENGEILVAEEYLQEFGNYLKAKAKFEVKEQLFKEQLKNAMLEHGVKSYSNDLMTVMLQEETVRKTLDQKALKEDFGEMLEPYYKESVIKPCIKISMK